MANPPKGYTAHDKLRNAADFGLWLLDERFVQRGLTRSLHSHRILGHYLRTEAFPDKIDEIYIDTEDKSIWVKWKDPHLTPTRYWMYPWLLRFLQIWEDRARYNQERRSLREIGQGLIKDALRTMETGERRLPGRPRNQDT